MQSLIKGEITHHEVPSYLLKYYRAHLERSSAPLDKFLPFIDSPFWQRAWFAYDGTYGGYLLDLSRIWILFNRADEYEVEFSEVAPWLAAEIRIALIKSSIHALASNIFPELIVKLVQKHIWTFSQALAYIKQIPHAKEKAKAIICLIEILDNEVLYELLPVAIDIKDDEERTNAIISILQKLPDASLEGCLSFLQSIDDKYYRARILNVIAKRLPENPDSIVVNQLVKCVKSIEDADKRLLAQVYLLRYIQGSQQKDGIKQILEDTRNTKPEYFFVRILIALSEEVTLNHISIILSEIPNIQNEWERARLLIALINKFDGNYLIQLSEIGYNLKNNWALEKFLIALARFCPKKQLTDIINIAQKITDEVAYANVLKTVLEVSPKEFLEVDAFSLKKVQYKSTQAQIMIMLFPFLSLGKQDYVLNNLSNIVNDIDFEFRIDSLIYLISFLPVNSRWSIISLSLNQIRKIDDPKKRAESLTKIVDYLPVDIQRETVIEALESVINIKIGDEAIQDQFISILHSMNEMWENEPWERRKLVFRKSPYQSIDLLTNPNLTSADALSVDSLTPISPNDIAQGMKIFLEQQGLLTKENVDSLQSAREIKNPIQKVDALISFSKTQHDSEQRLLVLLEALENICNITNQFNKRANKLSEIVVAIRVCIIGKIVLYADNARKIKNWQNLRDEYNFQRSDLSYRTELMLPKLIKKYKLWKYFSKLLIALSAYPRNELIGDLSTFIFINFAYRKGDITRVVYTALKDVTTWWP